MGRRYLVILLAFALLLVNLSYPLATGMHPKSSNLFSIRIPENDTQNRNVQRLSLSALEYSFRGTIMDNVDGYWDSNEYDLYEFEIKSGQFFRAEITLNRNVEGLFLMLFSGDSAQDIEEAAADIVYYGYSSSVYDIDYVEGTFASLYYQSSRTIKAHVAVFSYADSYMSSTSYTLSTSIPKFEEEGPSILSILLFLGVVVLIIFAIIKYLNRPKRNSFQSYGYSNVNNPYTTQQYQAPEDPTYQSQPSGMFCTGCGDKYTNPGQKFCNGCGSRI